MTLTPPIQYIADVVVDDVLDRELRTLLSTCFTGAQDEVFKHRRYFHEPPAHRWFIRGEDGTLVAHLALHERRLTAASHFPQESHAATEGHSYAVGGVAEVCVHPAYRGREYLKMLIAEAHHWMREHGYTFSVLFGNPRYYASSGYVAPPNLYHDVRDANGHLTPHRAEGALAASLTATPWPAAPIAYLPGLAF